ncbi:MAG: PilZ domain-containing protein [Lachnospiraceae bacterium]|nr:PilZ domain-containing protein [Lachnospiraceae bacterium]
MEKVIKPGIPVELIKNPITLDQPEAMDKKYMCSVHDSLEGSVFRITNPTQQSRMIPLHSGERFNAYFFLNKIYTAPVTVVRNVTDGKFRVVEMRLTGELEKYERRKFFRLDANLDVRYLLLTAENAMAFKEATKNGTLLTMDGFEKGTTVDISGGGVRFVSGRQLPEAGMVITHMIATTPSGEKKNYVFLGKIIKSEKHADVRDMFDHRMQFVDMKQEAREEFVRFIFEVERQRLKKRGGI